MFARALRTHPAAIPASGFYEWHSSRQGARKDKYLLQILIILSFTWPVSGIFQQRGHPRHFTILTTAANPSMQPLSPQNAANFKAQ